MHFLPTLCVRLSAPSPRLLSLHPLITALSINNNKLELIVSPMPATGRDARSNNQYPLRAPRRADTRQVLLPGVGSSVLGKEASSSSEGLRLGWRQDNRRCDYRFTCFYWRPSVCQTLILNSISEDKQPVLPGSTFPWGGRNTLKSSNST